MNIKNAITKKLATSSFKLKQNSPHILFVGGIGCVIAGTVLACKATLKVEPLLDEVKEDINAVKNELVDQPSHQRDVAYTYARSAALITKPYIPALIVGGAGIAALTGAHVQLTRRNTALTVGYAALHKAYSEYRARVREELGEEKERDLYLGMTEETVVGEDGKKQVVKVVDPNKTSEYARFFDQGCPAWKKNAEMNRLFIQCQQNYANQRLLARGYLFLNEVYDSLGLDISAAGQNVGWFLNGDGDNFVDFGMFEVRNSDFINGNEPTILLDFNVDGLIIDKI